MTKNKFNLFYFINKWFIKFHIAKEWMGFTFSPYIIIIFNLPIMLNNCYRIYYIDHIVLQRKLFPDGCISFLEIQSSPLGLFLFWWSFPSIVFHYSSQEHFLQHKIVLKLEIIMCTCGDRENMKLIYSFKLLNNKKKVVSFHMSSYILNEFKLDILK